MKSSTRMSSLILTSRRLFLLCAFSLMSLLSCEKHSRLLIDSWGIVYSTINENYPEIEGFYVDVIAYDDNTYFIQTAIRTTEASLINLGKRAYDGVITKESITLFDKDTGNVVAKGVTENEIFGGIFQGDQFTLTWYQSLSEEWDQYAEPCGWVNHCVVLGKINFDDIIGW